MPGEAPRANPIGAPPARVKPAAPGQPRTVAEQVFSNASAFNFFQAVRLLERMNPQAEPIGRDGPPTAEPFRFRAHVALNFPASSIHELRAAEEKYAQPAMVVTFFGLTGINGVMPRHYTDILMRQHREAKHAEKFALRDWFDLFTHRMLSLFYRAWEKYRFYIPYERGEHALLEPDPFTHGLLSLVGLGLPTLRNRLRVTVPDDSVEPDRKRAVAQIPDLALLHYAGLLSQRPRTAVGLQAMLQDYFRIPIEVQQFHGHWLQLEPIDQSRLGSDSGNCQLGMTSVVGERVWDIEGKIRIRVGPLDYEQFTEFVPDREPVPQRKAFFLLEHMTRLYLGPTLDFDVQLILKANCVPDCQLAEDQPPGPRLGWNTWIRTEAFQQPVSDAVFAG